MGLLYLFPDRINDENHVRYTEHEDGKVTSIELKTYGLPGIFWFYAIASLTVFLMLGLAVKSPLEKLLTYPNTVNFLIVYSMYTIYAFLPIIVFGFFFYQKSIRLQENQLVVVYKIFGIRFWRKIFRLNEATKLELSHFMDSPNLARIKGDRESLGFQNRGYYQLFILSEKRKYLLDRSSRKRDLIKLQEMLQLAWPAK
jgi:hypothetical protein